MISRSFLQVEEQTLRDDLLLLDGQLFEQFNGRPEDPQDPKKVVEVSGGEESVSKY